MVSIYEKLKLNKSWNTRAKTLQTQLQTQAQTKKSIFLELTLCSNSKFLSLIKIKFDEM